MLRKILCCALALLSIFSTIVFAVEANRWFHPQDTSKAVERVGDIRRLITGKTTYEEGEPIMVTAWSTNEAEKIVLYYIDEYGVYDMRWCRVGFAMYGESNVDESSSGKGSGVPVDISSGLVTEAASLDFPGSLPVGNYVVVLCNEDQTVRYCQVPITIVTA